MSDRTYNIMSDSIIAYYILISWIRRNPTRSTKAESAEMVRM
jgi:hypothetical protein